MKVTAEKYIIEMSCQELWNTAYDIKGAIERAIETHWVNHQDSWISGEKERLNRVKLMFNALGRPEIYDEINKHAERVFKQFNDNAK